VTVNSGPTRSESVEQIHPGYRLEAGQDTGGRREGVLPIRLPELAHQALPLHRGSRPMAVFLASPLAAATNGAVVRAKGGLVRSIL
jgi:hypothetical protein